MTLRKKPFQDITGIGKRACKPEFSHYLIFNVFIYRLFKKKIQLLTHINLAISRCFHFGLVNNFVV